MTDPLDPLVLDHTPMDTDPAFASPGGFVQLVNPVRRHFEGFIFANALHCDRVVEHNSAVGQTIVICGAGPSLRDHAAKWCARGDQVWGCNSALPWLYENGYPVTHGFTMDQTPFMLEEWYSTPPVEYLLASSVHPHLTELLVGRERTVRFYHNFVVLQKPPVEMCAHCSHNHPGTACAEAVPTPEGGRTTCDCLTYEARLITYEDWLYTSLYPRTLIAGSGLNATTRAIDVALYMGAERIVLLGADCAIRTRKLRPHDAMGGTQAERDWLTQHSEFHADGTHALAYGATATTFDGWIDGRYWVTKPDLAVTAVWLERWRRKLGRKRLTIIGDTLPNALQDKSEEFLDRMPAMVDSEGRAMRAG